MSDKNPLLALSGNIGDRFVKLSQQKQEPDIWYSERSLYKLRFGMDFHEYQEGEEETSEMAPILTMRHRIKTREEALKLQLSYRTLHTRFAKRTHTANAWNWRMGRLTRIRPVQYARTSSDSSPISRRSRTVGWLEFA